MTPTAFYRQHVATEAPRIDTRTFRPFWSVRDRTRLDRLLADGSIGLLEWRAAIRFRDAVQLLAGERKGERRVGGTTRSRPAAVDRLGASQFVRRVRVGLGPVATALVWSCIVDE